MGEVWLRCQNPECRVQAAYQSSALRISLYTHGVCTISFFCPSCMEQSEFPVPDRVAIELDRQGVAATVVHTPQEVLERPGPEVPPLAEAEAGLFERSSLEYFNERVYRELLR